MISAATTPDLVRLRHGTAPSPEAARLLDRAARFDAEMGFGPPPRAASGSSSRVWVAEIETCLHRHGVRHDDDFVLAAVLTIRETSPGRGLVDLVVDPDRRSIGVATAVVERLGVAPPAGEGWAGTGLRTLCAVAYGSHPAAERLARRFGLGTTAARSHLVRPADEGSPDGAPPAEVLPLDRDGLAAPPVDDLEDEDPATVRLGTADGFARVRPAGPDGAAAIRGIVTRGPAARRRASAVAVVGAAVAWLHDRAGSTIEALVDADDEVLLEAFRTLHFEHDRTDLLFPLD
ncbi:hypothetical protein ACQP04_07075 [Pseudonocardia halophobica]|uniref:hypothetical protein n=1 Tax=Pseudonocardia halophobica TaxID=29401 RepID=UPI003D8F3E8A